MCHPDYYADLELMLEAQANINAEAEAEAEYLNEQLELEKQKREIKEKLKELHRQYIRNGKYTHAYNILKLLRNKYIVLGYDKTGLEVEVDLRDKVGLEYCSYWNDLEKGILRGFISRSAALHIKLNV